MPATSSAYLRGTDALARGAWLDARDAFQDAIREEETAAALEGLGLAGWWLDLSELVFETRERAYRLYLDTNDRISAARIAVWLAWDCWAFRGESAVANGWLQRARRLLDGFPECAERAWLECREGALALLEEGDPDRAYAHAAEGIRIAKLVGNVDFEMLGRAVCGLALVASGTVADGMRGLDEVNTAVVAGEMKDLVAIGLSCCYMISACDRVRDYDRAFQWCTRLKAFCAKWGLKPLFAVCRTQYASICMWRGIWLEAEQELLAATDELAASRPAMTADGTVRLAELRRRQGRLAEADLLFEQAGAHPLAILGRAELAFDRGDARTAATEADRYLRRIPPHNRSDRESGLDLAVRGLIGIGDLAGASSAQAELAAIANRVGTASFKAASELAAGRVAFATGNTNDARRHLEDAVDLYRESGASYELARARLDLARALDAAGQIDMALKEGQGAIDLFAELQAELDLSRARTLLQSFSRTEASHDRKAGLTGRELEVLRWVADGLSNSQIAEKLYVSEHTIHRHLANIFGKFGVSSRAAAVAQAARLNILE